MPFTSKNPATGEVLATFEELTDAQVADKLAFAQKTYETWRQTSFAERKAKMLKLADVFKSRAREYGKLASLEMGKPITAAIAEVEKCAWVCEYYANETESILAPEMIKTEASESYVRFDPLGVVLAVMPWNFPFWQVLRFAAPAAMAGNVGVLKHASNVPQCAMAIEQAFKEAGFPDGVFQNLLVGSKNVSKMIANPIVKAVTLTGSEPAGMQVAAQSGTEIKKTVLELGGSDPFIVLADADVKLACETAAKARLQNTGQSCICAKRFIVVEEIADTFLAGMKAAFEATVVGDPLDEKTQIGPLANEQGLNDIAKQVEISLAKGARLITGGKRVDDKGYFYAPTILADVKPGMPAYDEELFGPVASVIVVKGADEAIRVANDSRFGLGSSLWTKDMALAKKLASQIEAGCCFINAMVKSDPRLPFGGIKKSGYGRELSHYGIKEFVNIKTVYIQ